MKKRMEEMDKQVRRYLYDKKLNDAWAAVKDGIKAIGRQKFVIDKLKKQMTLMEDDHK